MKTEEIIISHLYPTGDSEWKIQTNEEHTSGVAERAARFADEFGMESWGRILGVLHDKGKESYAFQQHIRKESGYEPNLKVEGDYHHAYVGGIIARSIYGNSSKDFLVNQIVSHHTGLHDSDELDGILSKPIPPEINKNVKMIKPNAGSIKLDAGDFHHLSRLLYSCLVDADYLDTEAFMDKESSALRNDKMELPSLLPMLKKYLESLKFSAKNTEVNKIRNQIQGRCRAMAESHIGFYSLTVPTGGGKTLSSLLWAIKHAIRNGQKRIIIAIPYTSIIMQTASILRNIFGEENVLEHHSNVDPESIMDECTREKLKLATENWDYPIVVTTNVQLFESMFSNKPSRCRKLHNIVNSVIILDEVQTLPLDYLQPIVDTLKTYNKLFKTSVLFTTASQPVLTGLIEGCNPRASFKGIENVTEIIPKEFRLHDELRRVKLEINNAGKTYDEIAGTLCKHKRVLCIVNTRKDAKELFQRLPNEGLTLHLSKMMCSDHIRETIELIKNSLKSGKEEVIRVVSTQLVEAGVDIDFPVVYRQESGLDSILQAAGRCNREGRSEISTTYVFSLSKEHNLPKGDMQDANNARLSLVGITDWFSPETMTSYFKQLYCRKETFDKKGINNYLYSPKSGMYFSTAAKKFCLIEDSGEIVIVCWKDSMGLVCELLKYGPSYKLMKKLSKYIVNVNKSDFDKLSEMGVLSLKGGMYVLEYKELYDKHIGLNIENNWQKTTLIV